MHQSENKMITKFRDSMAGRSCINLSALMLLAGFSQQSQASVNPGKYPNIVLILADDLGYGDVSAYNPRSKIITQNIDALARSGIKFLDAHTNSSVSTPTRYGLLTGRYAWRSELQSGVLDGYSRPIINNDRLTIAAMLKTRGYSTACIGKWHLGWTWQMKNGSEIDFASPIHNGPTSVGFDYFYGISASLDMPPYVYVEQNRVVSLPGSTGKGGAGLQYWRNGPKAEDFDLEDCLPLLTQKAVGYIDSNASKKNPFFLYFALTAPHTPILPQEEFRNKSGIGDYGDFVLEVDHMIGKIVQSLKKNKIFNNTIVIVTADNGCSPAAGTDQLERAGHFPGAGFRGYKGDLYEGGHRVPFIVAWPQKIKKAKESTQIVSTTDFMATFARLIQFDLNGNQGEDSYSFYDELSGKKSNTAKRTDLVMHSYYGDFSIRKGSWKLLLTPYSGGWSYLQEYAANPSKDSLPKFQLYNLDNDTGEKKNVVQEYPEEAAKLKELLEGYIANGRSTAGKVQKNDVPVKTKF